ncbi:MAG: hypothetical protein ACSHXW_19175 [Yoonia sp.]
MAGYQFAHMETYSAKGKTSAGPEDQHNKKKNGQTAWNAQQIIDELERLEHASQHIIPDRPGPEIVAGDVNNFADLRDAQLKAASVETKFPYTKPDGTLGQRKRKIRIDSASIYASVVSLPIRTEDALADQDLAAKSRAILIKAIDHERKRIENAGGRVMMGVIHWDEKYLHAHILALDPVRGVVRQLHPGQVSKGEVIEKAKGRKIKKSEVNKLGNIAYCDAMRGWQNDFYEAVFKNAGLMRYGPRRERLSTAAYKRAKEAAKFRVDDELHRDLILATKAEAENELQSAKAKTASAEQKSAAFETGAAAVLEEKIIYKTSTSKKPEGLKFGRNAPSDPHERSQLASRIQPAFDFVVNFAKKIAAVDKKMGTAEALLSRAERHEDALNDREDGLQLAEAQLNWRSGAVAKVVKSMKGWVPKSLSFVVAALERGEDPVPEKTADAFPDAWSVAKKTDLLALQRKIDAMPNATLAGCFSATQDAYLLTEDDAGLQSTFATGIRVLVHEAGQRGLDIETGMHNPSGALSQKRAKLHTDCPPAPIRVKRVIRQRQLVR